ncbi:MAG TPA: transposase [Terracidiphilus sp.]
MAAEIERVGLRLQLRKAQAEAGDIVLLYGDESEALTHPYLARAWAERGADLRVPAPGQAKKVAMMGTLDHVTRRLIVHTSRTKRSADFIAHLEQLDRLFGPKPGRVTRPVVLVEDNGPIHVSKIALAALDARKHWLTVEWLPKYAPELNDIEVVWRDLKAHHLAHQTFTDAEALDREIHAAVEALNRERNVDSFVNWRISASITGPWKSIPFLRRSTAGSMLLYGVGAGPPPDGVRRGKGRSNLRYAGLPGFSPSSSCRHCGLTQSIVPAGTPLREGRCLSCPKTVECFSFCAAAG